MPIATRPGPPSAQETVRGAIAEHHALVYRIAFRLLRNEADAEDVTQSVFVILLGSARSYAKARSSRSWLARVTVNRCVSWVRAESRRKRRERGWAEGCKLREKGARPMENETLKSAVASLPDQLRVPLCLFYQEGFKYREIAEACGCRESTVAKRIFAAKSRLRKLLARSGCVVAAGALERALEASEAISVPSDLAVRLSESLLGAGARCGTGAAGAGARGLDVLLRAVLAKGLPPLALSVLVVSGSWLGFRALVGHPDPMDLQEAASPATAANGLRRTPREQFREPSSDARRFAGTSRRAAPRGTASDGGDGPPSESEDGVSRAGPSRAVVSGHVRDASGRPVAGASVANTSSRDLTPAGPKTTTDETGYYELDLSASASGAPESGLVFAALDALGSQVEFQADAERLYFEKAVAEAERQTLDRALELKKKGLASDAALQESQVANAKLKEANAMLQRLELDRRDAAKLAAAARDDEAKVRTWRDITGATLPPPAARELTTRYERSSGLGTGAAVPSSSSRNPKTLYERSFGIQTGQCTSCHEPGTGRVVLAAGAKLVECPPGCRSQQIRLLVEAAGFEPQVSAPVRLTRDKSAAPPQAPESAEGDATPAISSGGSKDASNALALTFVERKGPETQWAWVLEEGQSDCLDFVLQPAPGLRGIVVSDEGAPLEGARVAVTAFTSDAELPASVLSTRTEADGSFLLENLPRGAYLLRVEADGFLPAEPAASGGEQIAVQMSQGASLRVRVERKSSHEPLESFRVEIRSGRRVVHEADTPAEGEVDIGGLPAGEYLVNAFSSDSSSQLSRASFGIRLGAGANETVTLEVENRARVAGKLTGALPDIDAGDATVFLLPRGEFVPAGGEPKRVDTDADGSFAIRNVPPGRYFLAAVRRSKDEGGLKLLATRELEVPAGLDDFSGADLDVAGPVKQRLTVDVVDAEGRPISGAAVRLFVMRIEAEAARAVTDARGRAELDVPPGEFESIVEAPGALPVRRILGEAPSKGGSWPAIVIGNASSRGRPWQEVLGEEPRVTVLQGASLEGLAAWIRRVAGVELSFGGSIEAAGLSGALRVPPCGPSPLSAALGKALEANSLLCEATERGLVISERR